MTTQSTSFQQSTLTIRGMTCPGCAATIERAINALPGVQAVRVNLSTKQAQVSYDPALVGAPQLAEAVTRAGYAVAPPEMQSVLSASSVAWLSALSRANPRQLCLWITEQCSRVTK